MKHMHEKSLHPCSRIGEVEYKYIYIYINVIYSDVIHCDWNGTELKSRGKSEMVRKRKRRKRMDANQACTGSSYMCLKHIHEHDYLQNNAH